MNRIYYKDKGFEASIKKKILPKGTWSNFLEIKLKVKLPRSIYREIVLNMTNQLHDRPGDGDWSDFSYTSEPEFTFLLEDVESKIFDHEKIGWWNIKSRVQRMHISSEFNNDEVLAIFDLLIWDFSECKREEVRDILLGEIIES